MADPLHAKRLNEGAKTFNAWRAEYDRIPDLSQLDLSGKNLQEFDLAECDLSACDLSGACLGGSNLFCTILDGSRMLNADLNGADLYATSLRHCDLTGAWLDAVRFYQADFTGTVFNTYFASNQFADIDLSGAIGLDDAPHYGPSSVGVDTLIRSSPNLPIRFLQGCGLSSTLLAYADSLLSPVSLEFFRTFLSYSSIDSDFADQLYSDLSNRIGPSIWQDKHQIVPGDSIEREIDKAINIRTDKMILVCSAASLSDSVGWWVDREVSRALGKEMEFQKKNGYPVTYLVPLSIDSYLFDDDCSYYRTAELRSRSVADFSGRKSGTKAYESQLDKLVNSLRVAGPITPGGFRFT